MNEQREIQTEVPAPGSEPLKNGRHEGFAQACLSMSQTDAYKAHYPGARQWKPSSVQVKACDLAGKVRPRIEWLKSQAATSAIASRTEALEIVTAILRDGSEPPMIRLAAVDRMAKLERWDAARPDRKHTQVVFNFTNEKGESLIRNS